jgi:hypothetical protein
VSIARAIYDALRSDKSNVCVRVQHKSVKVGESMTHGHEVGARQYLVLASPILLGHPYWR